MESNIVEAARADVVGQLGGRNSLVTPQTTSDGNFLGQISNNPFFTAASYGVGLAGFGAVVTVLQKGCRRGASLLRRRLLVNVEINNKDEIYPWFLFWMTRHQRSQLFDPTATRRKSKAGIIETLMRRFTPGFHDLALDSERIQHPNGSFQTTLKLVPGPGRHFIRYKNAFFMVDRVRETKSMDITRGTPWETIKLTTLYSKRQIFQDLFTEAVDLSQQATEGKTIIYTPRTASWERHGEPRRKRPLDSVMLDRGVKERLVTDIRSFLQCGKWYYDRNIPYRRGYLLHGPPGGGKTSFVQALAADLDYNIAILNLGERGMADDRLSYLLGIVPQRTFVLLEDVDGALPGRESAGASGYSGALTFSGLLNAIDGAASAEERVMFLTTNHPNRLDSALIRPGRVDLSMRFGNVTKWQIQRLWQRFYEELDDQDSLQTRFIERLEQLGVIEKGDTKTSQSSESNISAAALQGLFLHNKGNPEGAISMAQELSPDSQIFKA